MTTPLQRTIDVDTSNKIVNMSCVFKWSGLGFAAAIFVSQNIACISKLFLAKYQLKMAIRPWIFSFAIPMAFAVVASTTLGYVFRLFMEESFVRLVLATLVSVSVFTAVSLRFVCDSVERAYLRKQLAAKTPFIVKLAGVE